MWIAIHHHHRGGPNSASFAPSEYSKTGDGLVFGQQPAKAQKAIDDYKGRRSRSSKVANGIVSPISYGLWPHARDERQPPVSEQPSVAIGEVWQEPDSLQ